MNGEEELKKNKEIKDNEKLSTIFLNEFFTFEDDK